jgi:hypothetical protein
MNRDKSFLLSLTAVMGFCASGDDDDERRLSRQKELADHNTNVSKNDNSNKNSTTRRPHPRRITPPAGK